MSDRLVQKTESSVCTSKGKDIQAEVAGQEGARPECSILNPKKKWVSAAKTDIAQTFKRIRKEMADAQKIETQIALEKVIKVRTIGGGK